MYYFLNSSIGLIGWIVIILLFVSQHRRIKRLESEMRRFNSTRQSTELEQQMPTVDSQRKKGVLAPGESEWDSAGSPQQSIMQSEGPLLVEKFIIWLKEDWLLKLGVMLLLIGFGWLVTYAFMNNWIGPMGRIAFGLLAGAVILSFGWVRMQRYIHQGSIFLVFGATVVLLTIFAARELYNFFTPTTALGVMFLTSVFVALASIRYKMEALALSGILLGAIAPLLTNAPSKDYVSLYSYLLVLIVGVVWIVVVTGWRSLTFASLVVFAMYSVPNLQMGPYYYASNDRSILLLFEYAVAAIIFVVTIASFMRKTTVRVLIDMITAGSNGLLLLIWILVVAPDEWKSLLIIAWMLVFIIGAFTVFRITGARQPFYIYAAVGITMLASATSVELQGHTLTIAYAFEAVAITVATYLVMRNIKIAERTTVLMLVPFFLSAPSFYASSWSRGIMHADFAVLLIMSCLLFFLGLFLRWLYQTQSDTTIQRWYPTIIIVASGYAFVLIWLSLHALIDADDTATTLSLVVYTIVGLITYFVGKFQQRIVVQYYGGILLGIVVVRLLSIDVWGMALAGRIVTFFLVGTMLIGTAFIGRHKQVDSTHVQ